MRPILRVKNKWSKKLKNQILWTKKVLSLKRLFGYKKKPFALAYNSTSAEYRGYLLGESKPLAIQIWDTPTGQGQMECAFNLKTAGRPEL